MVKICTLFKYTKYTRNFKVSIFCLSVHPNNNGKLNILFLTSNQYFKILIIKIPVHFAIKKNYFYEHNNAKYFNFENI